MERLMAFATCCVGLTIDVFRHPSSNLKELKGAKLSWSAFVMILSGLLGVILRVIAMSIEDAALSKSLGLINSILSLVCLRRSVALKRPFSVPRLWSLWRRSKPLPKTCPGRLKLPEALNIPAAVRGYWLLLRRLKPLRETCLER